MRPPGAPGAYKASLPDGPALTEASTDLLAQAGVIEEEDLESNTRQWLAERGLLPEDFHSEYGLLAPEDAVIIRPYGGEDDDILLQELRPRFVVMYEPNLAFIRRLEVRVSQAAVADNRCIRTVIPGLHFECTR
jgi:DNA excision repair protein ERCC-4